MTLPDLLDTMTAAARAGGAVALRHFAQDEVAGLREKGVADYQTTADVEVEQVILAALRRDWPGAAVKGEEEADQAGGAGRGAGLTFLIDPIDGTTNFAFRIPLFAVVICAVREGLPVAGVVYDPCRDEMFAATLGGGASLNGKPLPECPAVEPSRAIIGVGLPMLGQLKAMTAEAHEQVLRAVVAGAGTTRRLGSAALALAYVACGRHHAMFEDSLDRLDYLASALILRECGGIVTDFAGRTQNDDGAVLGYVPSLEGWLAPLFRAGSVAGESVVI